MRSSGFAIFSDGTALTRGAAPHSGQQRRASVSSSTGCTYGTGPGHDETGRRLAELEIKDTGPQPVLTMSAVRAVALDSCGTCSRKTKAGERESTGRKMGKFSVILEKTR
jgi:hypothetical protein